MAQASSQEGIKTLTDRVHAIEGLSVVSAAAVERPKLDRDVDEFINIYQQVVKRTAQTSPGKHPGTTSYIIVDIEKEAIQQIFTTVFFIDEVIFCDVIEGGTKLVGMITGVESLGRTPRIIEKLNHIDGVRRIREAKIIKLRED